MGISLRRLFVISLLPLALGLVAALCNTSIPAVVRVVETVEVIKEVEVVKEVVVVKEGGAVNEAEVVQEGVAPLAMTEGPKEEIVFSGGWDSLAVLNAIAMYIVEHGYGYPVKEINISVDTMMVYLPLGDVDVSMELWRFSKQDWYDKNLSAGRIIDVGAIFESSTQGLYVPRYMIEGDPARGIEPTAPDLKSVTDLPTYWELFADSANPGKGALVGCMVKWKCYKITQVKTAFYGLDEHFNLLTPRTEAGRNVTIAQAFTRGEPVLLYHWEPSSLLGSYDLVRLEEPEYTDECWAELEMAINQDPPGSAAQACAFPVNDIHTAVHGGLLDRAPEVVTLLKNMFVGTARTSELTAHMADNKVDPRDTAIYYLQTYEPEWRQWVPADVAERVKASLP
jgi:glycine betaine/proline transport system substrate-binding protein